jgi:hypothetical protein
MCPITNEVNHVKCKFSKKKLGVRICIARPWLPIRPSPPLRVQQNSSDPSRSGSEYTTQVCTIADLLKFSQVFPLKKSAMAGLFAKEIEIVPPSVEFIFSTSNKHTIY